MKRSLSNHEIAEIKSMRSLGISSRRIGNVFGISKTWVDKVSKKEYGVVKQTGGMVKKTPLPFKWDNTEDKIFAMLTDIHAALPTNGGVIKYITQNKLSKRYYKALLDLKIIAIPKKGGTTTWERDPPTKAMASEVWSKCYVNRKKEDFIGYPPYFKANPALKSCLTLAELKQLWKMYQADCSIFTMSLYLGAQREIIFEGIEAAKHVWGGGMEQLKQQQIKQKYLTTTDGLKTTIVQFEQSNEPYQRPPAIYTNQSEWQRFVQTGS